MYLVMIQYTIFLSDYKTILIMIQPPYSPILPFGAWGIVSFKIKRKMATFYPNIYQKSSISASGQNIGHGAHLHIGYYAHRFCIRAAQCSYLSLASDKRISRIWWRKVNNPMTCLIDVPLSKGVCLARKLHNKWVHFLLSLLCFNLEIFCPIIRM